MRFGSKAISHGAAPAWLGGLVLSLAMASGPVGGKPYDAVAEAQTPRAAPSSRPESQKSEHDRSMFSVPPTPPSERFESSARPGRLPILPRPLNAKKPMQTFENEGGQGGQAQDHGGPAKSLSR